MGHIFNTTILNKWSPRPTLHLHLGWFRIVLHTPDPVKADARKWVIDVEVWYMLQVTHIAIRFSQYLTTLADSDAATSNVDETLALMYSTRCSTTSSCRTPSAQQGLRQIRYKGQWGRPRASWRASVVGRRTRLTSSASNTTPVSNCRCLSCVIFS